MSSLTQTFLQTGSQVTAPRYFAQGGSLEDVITQVTQLITQDSFFNNPPLGTQVQEKIGQCIKHAKALPPERAAARFFRLWSGRKSDQESIPEAEQLYRLLNNRYLSSLSPSVIFGPEVTLRSAMQTITNKVLRSDVFLTNDFYRAELRAHIYASVRKEWELGGIWWWWNKTYSDDAIALIRKIDELSHKVLVQPVQDRFGDYSDELVFKHSAWLTDDLLKEFAVKMLGLNKIHLMGCFQVTDAGIKAAAEARSKDYPLEIIIDTSDEWVIVERVSSHFPS